MEFADHIASLSARSKVAERQALTEEATKTSVVLPFIQSLGFDIFNLDEVIPEFVADVGTKKGEKVDFALKIDGKISILVEVKPINCKIGETQFSQLFRYFSVTEARLAILTNGREAWFFSDTDEPNKMDKKPFFTFDFQSYDKSGVCELSRFQKHNFAISEIIEAASNLKYTRAAANYLKGQLEYPDEEFVRMVGRQIHEGSITKSVSEQLRPAIQSALDEIIRDRIQDKLSITFGEEKTNTQPKEELKENVDAESGIVTTDEEREGHMIIRAIGAKVATVDRIVIRDSKSYCAIIMDDNNRKPICRLYFNSAKTKQVGIFDGSKNETKHKIEKIEDIYLHSGEIESVISSYL